MKEITRIHLAKVAYDIEVDAKKDIQQYITALEKYANDSELLSDIEIRITELLAERGVAAGGVITKDDVTAVRERLGEPSEFAPEGESLAVDPEVIDEPRRVYRDLDGALLGGVLAGFARFFGIDALWVRLIFIVLLPASFGSIMIIYLLLWWVIPPARTAAEKLRMSGKPVTLASIKQLGEQAQPAVNNSARVLQGILAIGTGVVLMLTGVGALIGTAAVGLRASFAAPEDFGLATNSPAVWVMLVLAVVAGLLFATLCFILANATFRRHWDRRTTTAVVAIIIAGIVAFSSAIGVGAVAYYSERDRMNELRKTTSVDLPGNFKGVKSLKIEKHDDLAVGMRIEYIVSDKNRWELDALPGVKPQFEISDDSMSATIELTRTPGVWSQYYELHQPTLRIYGPALTHLDIEENSSVSYSTTAAQETLAITTKRTGFELQGAYENVVFTNKGGGVADLEAAAITNLVVDNQGGMVKAGVVRTLKATIPDACRASSDANNPNIVIQAQGVSSGVIVYNGEQRSAATVSNACGRVAIGDDEFNEGREN